MSLVQMSEAVEPAAEQTQRKSRLLRFARPAFGVFLPLLLALGWELAVRAGLVDGRLVPPPSVIYATFPSSRASGELQRHALATLAACRRRLRLRRRRRHIARRDHRLFDVGAPAARSDPAGPARDSVDRLGAAVHSLARHLRSLEGDADRGRRVLPGLSRRHGRGDVGRPQDRRGRPRLPPDRPADGAAHSAARGAAGLRDRAALRPRPRLDVRGRRRIHGRVRRPRLSADRRPATRQAGADRRRHRRLRGASANPPTG